MHCRKCPANNVEVSAETTEKLYFLEHDLRFSKILHLRWKHSFLFVHVAVSYLRFLVIPYCRSQWPRGLRRRSAAARLLRSWVRIPPGVWMFVCCECCMLSGRGLCDELITRPEESYRLLCVVVCDLETSRMRRP